MRLIAATLVLTKIIVWLIPSSSSVAAFGIAITAPKILKDFVQKVLIPKPSDLTMLRARGPILLQEQKGMDDSYNGKAVVLVMTITGILAITDKLVSLDDPKSSTSQPAGPSESPSKLLRK